LLPLLPRGPNTNSARDERILQRRPGQLMSVSGKRVVSYPARAVREALTFPETTGITRLRRTAGRETATRESAALLIDPAGLFTRGCTTQRSGLTARRTSFPALARRARFTNESRVRR